MARGYCPNQECPNIDVLDDKRPCPTCGREVKELSPREYWRARTIKMMHAHEIAEIAEIQEVARRTLGEASVVPKVQIPEDSAPRQEEEGSVEAGLPDSAEPLIGSEEIVGGEPELVTSAGEIENVGEVEESLASEEESVRPEVEEASGGLEASALELELFSKDVIVLEDSSDESEDRSQESEGLEQTGSEISDKESEPSDASHDVLTAESKLDGVELESESAPSESEASEQKAGGVLGEILEVEDVPFVEGFLSVAADFQSPDEELEEREQRYVAEEVPSGEVSEAKEIDELEGRGESPREATDTELSEWKQSELLRRESAEEVSAPMDLPVEGGVERPASPVRIITFREGGTEIGICPFCGRFVRGSDLARHKLKHRVRNVFGFQADD